MVKEERKPRVSVFLVAVSEAKFTGTKAEGQHYTHLDTFNTLGLRLSSDLKESHLCQTNSHLPP